MSDTGAGTPLFLTEAARDIWERVKFETGVGMSVAVAADDLADIEAQMLARSRPGTDPAEDSCPCGHSDNEHVHYCSADVDRGVCPCNAEYARLAGDGEPYVGPDVHILGIKESPGKGNIRC